jgi:hypothetical protein
MRVLFCEKTSDISYLLSRKEAIELKRTKHFTPSLEAESKGLIFHLMGTQSKKYMGVKEPRGDYNHYWTTISDQACQDLLRDDECGTRYGNFSRVKVCISDNF